jgi:hypothetical protein
VRRGVSALAHTAVPPFYAVPRAICFAEKRQVDQITRTHNPLILTLAPETSIRIAYPVPGALIVRQSARARRRLRKRPPAFPAAIGADIDGGSMLGDLDQSLGQVERLAAPLARH